MNDINPNQEAHHTVLSTRKVGEITGNFRILSYQRGYRWGRNEVRQLLDDIWENGCALYRLQPIVVQTSGDGAWELIDGQQRLTTLYLIYRFLTKSGLKNVPPLYGITYQTRPDSAAFLEDPDECQATRNIDYHFMHGAYLEIENWFGPTGHDRQERADMLFLSLKKYVEVIWYQASQSENSIDLFSRLNIGRIPLTSAELIKAHLLTQFGALNSDHVHAVAAQWDSIERDLRHSDLWAFVSIAEAETYPTKITLLLDTIARRYPIAHGRNFGNHHTFESLREHISGDPSGIWNEVVELHAHILGWFENHDLYHRIGFLVAAGDSFPDIVDLARHALASEFSDALTERIRNRLDLTGAVLGAIGYETDKDRTKSQCALLLMNVETVRRRKNSGERFPFAAHHAGQWSLEHIHAQNAQALTTEAEWSEWLDRHVNVLVSLPVSTRRNELIARLEAIIRPVRKSDFDTHSPDVLDFLTSESGTEGAKSVGDIHDITNLALLQRGANSALSNSAFEVKRQMILSMDKSGDYIPVCTRQVFLKYFGDEGARSAYFWSPQDRKAYFDAIEMLLGPYLKETN